MKIGLNSVLLDKESLDTVFKRVKEHNYDCIEINAETLPWAKPNIDNKTPIEKLDKINNLAKEYNLNISSIGAHIDLSCLDIDLRNNNISYVNKCVDHAKYLNSPIVHILSGELIDLDMKEKQTNLFYNSVEKILNYAEKKNVKIAIEAIAGHVFHSHLDFINIWKSIDNEKIYVNYDPSHFEAQKINLDDTLDLLQKKIIHVHIKDAMGLYPYFQFPPLGKGNIDFRKIISKLHNFSYSGTLSIEYEAQVYGWEKENDEILKESHEMIDNIIQSL
jgi:sugar phosphate isomerase/epimerase